ncbi:MAG: hypothetical protein ACOCX3_02345, partial [Chloroflexota bacterium]
PEVADDTLDDLNAPEVIDRVNLTDFNEDDPNITRILGLILLAAGAVLMLVAGVTFFTRRRVSGTDA